MQADENFCLTNFILDVLFNDNTHVHYVLPNFFLRGVEYSEYDLKTLLKDLKKIIPGVVNLSDELIDNVKSVTSWSIGNFIDF